MRPPRLWIAYCSILKVPPRLQMAWWAALWRSRWPAARTICDGFQRLSTQRVVQGDFLQQQAGPAPMVRLLEACVQDRLVSRAKANQLIDRMLAFTVVEVKEDWRGVPLPSQRWCIEEEAKEKRHSNSPDHCDARAGV
jgi:hypothetical protein